MLYFTGFHNWEKQFGELVSIANGEPDNFKGQIRRLPFLMPDWDAVQLWKGSYKTEEDWRTFVNMYRIVCRKRWDSSIAPWLETLKPENDVTLLCWEPTSKYCHRSLVAKIVEVYRPDCYGGLDISNPYRKIHIHKKVKYKISVCDCPWNAGFSFEIAASGGGICAFNDHPDYPHLKGVYALPEHAIEGAISFITASEGELAGDR